MMSEKPDAAASAHPVIAPEEYDFSGVPKTELLACLMYEYARESRAVIAEVVADRKRSKQWENQGKGKSRTVKFGPGVQNAIQSHLLMSLSLRSGFPGIPWQGLSEKDRQGMLKSVAAIPRLFRYIATSKNPPLSLLTEENIRRPYFLARAKVNEAETMTLDMWKQWYRKCHPTISDNDPIKFGFFAINLNYGHPLLVDEFKGQLRGFEGKPLLEWLPPAKKSGKDKPAGRKQSLRDPLKALGAMRLRYFCDSFADAKKLMRRKPNGTWYSRRDNCTRACNRALEKFKGLFGWLDSNKPIHFTESWRGGTQK